MSNAIGIEHVHASRDTTFRTRWFDTEPEAQRAVAAYIEIGAAQAGVVEERGSCLGQFRVWAHFDVGGGSCER